MPISQWGREHPDEIDTPDEVNYVHPVDALEHGHWGTLNDTTDRHHYTVAGVVEAASERRAGVEAEGLDTSAAASSGRGKGKHEDAS